MVAPRRPAPTGLAGLAGFGLQFGGFLGRGDEGCAEVADQAVASCTGGGSYRPRYGTERAAERDRVSGGVE